MLRPQVAALLRQFPQVKHLPVEDGKGKPLGRSFRVKLWPTFVFMKDGRVVKVAVRPGAREVQEGFQALAAADAGPVPQEGKQ